MLALFFFFFFFLFFSFLKLVVVSSYVCGYLCLAMWVPPCRSVCQQLEDKVVAATGEASGIDLDQTLREAKDAPTSGDGDDGDKQGGEEGAERATAYPGSIIDAVPLKSQTIMREYLRVLGIKSDAELKAVLAQLRSGHDGVTGSGAGAGSVGSGQDMSGAVGSSAGISPFQSLTGNLPVRVSAASASKMIRAERSGPAATIGNGSSPTFGGVETAQMCAQGSPAAVYNVSADKSGTVADSPPTDAPLAVLARDKAVVEDADMELGPEAAAFAARLKKAEGRKKKSRKKGSKLKGKSGTNVGSDGDAGGVAATDTAVEVATGGQVPLAELSVTAGGDVDQAELGSLAEIAVEDGGGAHSLSLDAASTKSVMWKLQDVVRFHADVVRCVRWIVTEDTVDASGQGTVVASCGDDGIIGLMWRKIRPSRKKRPPKISWNVPYAQLRGHVGKVTTLVQGPPHSCGRIASVIAAGYSELRSGSSSVEANALICEMDPLDVARSVPESAALLVSGGSDGRVLLWGVPAVTAERFVSYGRGCKFLMASLKAHDNCVWSVDVGHVQESLMIASCGADGLVSLFDIGNTATFADQTILDNRRPLSLYVSPPTGCCASAVPAPTPGRVISVLHPKWSDAVDATAQASLMPLVASFVRRSSSSDVVDEGLDQFVIPTEAAPATHLAIVYADGTIAVHECSALIDGRSDAAKVATLLVDVDAKNSGPNVISCACIAEVCGGGMSAVLGLATGGVTFVSLTTCTFDFLFLFLFFCLSTCAWEMCMASWRSFLPRLW